MNHGLNIRILNRWLNRQWILDLITRLFLVFLLWNKFIWLGDWLKRHGILIFDLWKLRLLLIFLIFLILTLLNAFKNKNELIQTEFRVGTNGDIRIIKPATLNYQFNISMVSKKSPREVNKVELLQQILGKVFDHKSQ